MTTTGRVLLFLDESGPVTAQTVGAMFWPHRSGCGGHGPDRPTSIALRFLGRLRKRGLVRKEDRAPEQSLWSRAHA